MRTQAAKQDKEKQQQAQSHEHGKPYLPLGINRGKPCPILSIFFFFFSKKKKHFEEIRLLTSS